MKKSEVVIIRPGQGAHLINKTVVVCEIILKMTFEKCMTCGVEWTLSEHWSGYCMNLWVP
jgi:hypothetical protein